jgi:hypothetical protein
MGRSPRGWNGEHERDRTSDAASEAGPEQRQADAIGRLAAKRPCQLRPGRARQDLTVFYHGWVLQPRRTKRWRYTEGGVAVAFPMDYVCVTRSDSGLAATHRRLLLRLSDLHQYSPRPEACALSARDLTSTAAHGLTIICRCPMDVLAQAQAQRGRAMSEIPGVLKCAFSRLSSPAPPLDALSRPRRRTLRQYGGKVRRGPC